MSGLPGGTLGQLVIDECRKRGANPQYKAHKNEWQMNDPRKSSSDSKSLWIGIADDGTYGRWYYHAGVEGGSLHDFAKELGIDIPQSKSNGNGKSKSVDLSRVPDELPTDQTIVTIEKSPPLTMAEESRRYGHDENAYTQAGCAEVVYRGRPAIRIPTEQGIARMKFLDGKKPPYLPESDDLKSDLERLGLNRNETSCWFGLERAVSMAKENDLPLVLCNGLSSTIVSQNAYGVPAFCWTDGEGRALPDYLKPRLEAYLKEGLSLFIALDNDDTGRLATKKIVEKLSGYSTHVMQIEFGGKKGYDLRDYCVEHKTNIVPKLKALAQNINALLPRPEFTDTSKAHWEYMHIAGGLEKLVGEIMIVPFAQWHKKGGLCRVIQPRKMVGIVGASGSGKTSLVESWAELWNQQGYDGIFYGREWSPVEYHARRVQRYGGFTVEQWLLCQLWFIEEQRGVPEDKRHGVKPDKKLYEKSIGISRKLAQWPGQMEYCDVIGDINDACEAIAERMLFMQRAGRRVGFVVFDYLQLMNYTLANGDENKVTGITGTIKDFCADNDIVALVLSQPNKTDAKEQKKNKLLGEESGHFATSNQFNLFVTANLKYHENPETGEWEKTGYGLFNICKNSGGQSGVVPGRFDGAHYLWRDQHWTTEEFNQAMAQRAYNTGD